MLMMMVTMMSMMMVMMNDKFGQRQNRIPYLKMILIEDNDKSNDYPNASSAWVDVLLSFHCTWPCVVVPLKTL